MTYRNFISIQDYAPEELRDILALATRIKQSPDDYRHVLRGKNLGLIFEKPSTRTRVSFQTGIHQLGGAGHYLAPDEMQLGKREEVKDIARTLSRYMDGLVLRTFKHETIMEFAKFSTIPVINGLSDRAHPCQAMADYMTIGEKFADPTKVTLAFIGDGNNVLHSLVILLAKLGVSVNIASPKGYRLQDDVMNQAYENAERTGAKVTVFDRPEDAVKTADVVYTDVFVSMGEEDLRDKKIKAFDGFQVNAGLLSHCEKEPYIMHCLPAHRGEEITDDVMESPRSIIFDQAENRLHVQKAILCYLMADGGTDVKPKYHNKDKKQRHRADEMDARLAEAESGDGEPQGDLPVADDMDETAVFDESGDTDEQPAFKRHHGGFKPRQFGGSDRQGFRPRRDWSDRHDRSGSDRPGRNDRPFGRKPYRDDARTESRFGGNREGFRPRRDFGDRSERGGDRPFGRKPFGDRGERSGSDRPFGRKPFGARSSGSRFGGGKSFGDRKRHSSQGRSKGY